MANKSKFSEEVTAAICESLEAGATRKAAHTAAGIPSATFYAWLGYGTQSPPKDQKYADFVEAIEAAEGEMIVTAVKAIKAAGAKSWQAWAWLLERRHAGDYGAIPRVLVQKSDAPKKVDPLEGKTREELEFALANNGCFPNEVPPQVEQIEEKPANDDKFPI